MKANELRIGNYVTEVTRSKNINGYQTWTKIWHIDTYQERVMLNNGRWSIFNDIDPTPLTEQWLLDFGFTQYGDWCSKSYISISIKYNKTTYMIDGMEDYIKHCEYVHQIQNLYFALTGEELTYKQPLVSN